MSTTPNTAGSNLLRQLSDEMAGAVERAGAAVVRVNARRRLPATGIVWSTNAASGDALVISANHVVERDEDITITSADGRELPATLVGRDPSSDIALLKVANAGLDAAERADAADDPRVGGFVFALGRAGELAASAGVVSAVIGERPGGRGRRAGRLIGSDAAMFPGFSGGPLIDASGRVLGMVSSHLGRGHTLAVPAAELDALVAALQAHGRVRRGYLGVGAQQAQLPAALKDAHGVTQDVGLLLVTVDETGPAAAAGLTIGDILLSVDGQPVQGLDDLRAALGAEKVGQGVALRTLRGGEPRDVTVTVGEQPF